MVDYVEIRYLLRFLALHPFRVFAYYRFGLAMEVAVALLTAGS